MFLKNLKGAGKKILPFKPYIYNSELVDIKDVVSPPYDVIDEKLQDNLYKKSDFNIIRLELGKEFSGDNKGDNRYSRANGYFKDWIKRGILKLENENSIYIYIQKFAVSGVLYERIGFISLFALNKADEDDSGGNNNSIYGHEMTLSKPKEDRFNLMEATKANFSPIFSIFEDKDLNVLNILTGSIKSAAAKKIFDFKDDSNTEHILYRISDESIIKSIQNEMDRKSFYIADGHHRFETCVNFRNYIRKNGISGVNADTCMMYFAPSNQKGLIILPTHRCIVNKKIELEAFLDEIKADFNIRKVDLKDLPKETKKAGENSASFGFAHNSGNNFILSFKNNKTGKDAERQKSPLESLDVSILENYVLKKALKISRDDIDNQRYLIYEKDAGRALEKLNDGVVNAVFFMNPTKIEDVIKIASQNLRMPQKSTFFYPKIITGLTINPLIS
ncbi:MAG: DUF1015 domain-containing protein [Deltaproteobacteria bacterium]|jgi:uncharacterized protein (DUF1015 family)|nr:DUF1015 domain-containing protein [Deltaproteobacteria bacterium]